MNISDTYDALLKQTLEQRLNRPAKTSEIINADNDSDLVTETLWQLVVAINDRLTILEAKK